MIETLELLSRHIRERSSLSFTGRRTSILKASVEERMFRLGLPDMNAYLRYLLNTVSEEGDLLDLLTTKETFFFRNPKQFAYLMENIIPFIEEKRVSKTMQTWGNVGKTDAYAGMKLRILSAGCASGEEPYSVAMAVLESLRYSRAWDIEILAGDISAGSIRTASAGYYEKEKLRSIPQHYLDKYLERETNGATIKEEVKKIVKFRLMNLNDFMSVRDEEEAHVEAGSFDIIFCRNVMIYFSPDAQQRLVDALYRILVPGGYLFTGDAEPLHLYRHDFHAVTEADCLIYRKADYS
jgi:chemotaxis protein methyltransferase CheR